MLTHIQPTYTPRTWAMFIQMFSCKHISKNRTMRNNAGYGSVTGNHLGSNPDIICVGSNSGT